MEPGERIFRIVSTKRLRAEGFVNAAHVKGDLKGRTVVLKPQSAAASETAFYGKVVFVSPEIDPVNEEVLIYADVDNANSRLRPGNAREDDDLGGRRAGWMRLMSHATGERRRYECRSAI